MPRIQNVSRDDIEKGRHIRDSKFGCVLIQISDPDSDHPTPAWIFDKKYQFKFLDIEDHQDCINDNWRPSQNDAEQIAYALKEAMASGMDVVVHCHMGVCRSGAVTAAGEILGFEPVEPAESPNASLKKKLLSALGLGFDPETSAFNN